MLSVIMMNLSASEYSDANTEIYNSGDPLCVDLTGKIVNNQTGLDINKIPLHRTNEAPLSFDLCVDSLFLSSTKKVEIFKGIVQNNGMNSIENFSIHFFTDNNLDAICNACEIFSSTVNLHLDPGVKMVVTGEWIHPTPGAKAIGLYIQSESDENQENNQQLITSTVSFDKGCLLINEIMAKPLPEEPEWIELYNPSPYEINLSGWFIADQDSGNKKLITKENIVIHSKDFILVTDHEIPNLPDSTQCIQIALPSLNNDGEDIYLFDHNQNLIEHAAYAKITDWDKGYSLERIQYSDSSLNPENWMISTSPTGSTAGYYNSVSYMELPNHCQIQVEPDPFSPDNDGIEDEVTITFGVPVKQCRATLCIYDIRGRHVRTLLGGVRSGAKKTCIWEGKTDQGKICKTGIYIIYFQAIDDLSGQYYQKKTTVVLAKKL